MKIISINKVGSYLYNLTSPESDVDYVMLYKRPVEHYLTLDGCCSDTMRSQTIEGGLRPIDYTYWDVRKFLRMAENNSFSAIEFLYATEAYTESAEYQYLLRMVNPRNFCIKSLAFQSMNLMNDKRQRGYIKAFQCIFLEFLLQKRTVPASLNVDYILESIDLDNAVKQNIIHMFSLKRKNNKFVDISLFNPDYVTRIADLPEKQKLDYTPVFHNIILNY